MEDKEELYQQFEREFGAWIGVEDVVGCSSGTAALHLALESLAKTRKIPPGSEVIVPDLTMVACARAVTLAGMYPVFVDCRDDLLMNERAIPGSITHRTRAIMAVHVYGRQCNMGAIATIAEANGLAVVEDLAEAHGIQPHPRTDAACWSFYKNKIIHGEEGGAVAFDDPETARVARSLRSLGFTDEHDFTHLPRGHNYRLSNAHAKLMLDSLKQAYPAIVKRREIEDWYNRRIPKEWQMPKRDRVWVYDLRIEGMTRDRQDRLVRMLREDGVRARHCFKPMTTLEEYQGRQSVSQNAPRLSQEVIYLPADDWMTEWDVNENCDKLLQAVEKTSRD